MSNQVLSQQSHSPTSPQFTGKDRVDYYDLKFGIKKSKPILIPPARNIIASISLSLHPHIDSHNQNPKAFVWTASVENIMRKISKYKDLLVTGH